MNFISPQLKNLNLEVYMREALMEAEASGLNGELPIGAILVVDGQIIARGRCRQRQQQSRIQHAETEALQQGGRLLFEQPDSAVLFATLEPCPMCLGTAVTAHVPHIVYALHDENTKSRDIVANVPYVKRRMGSYYGGVLEADSRLLFSRFAPEMLQCIMRGGSR